MPLSRSISQWSTDEYAASCDLARRIVSFVRENEPETLVFEWYGDPRTGTIIWNQIYADEEAFLRHAGNMGSAGFLEEARGILKSEWAVILQPPTTPQGKQMAEQAGIQQFEEVAGVNRLNTPQSKD